MARANLENKKYGRLKVKSFAGTDAWGKSEWLCECECGKVVTVGISNLNQGHNKSCGCLRRELTGKRLWQGCGELSKDFWSSIKRSAKSRNIDFNVTIEYAWKLFLEQNRKCKLSGLDINLYSHKRDKIRRTASLDRIDNNKGYVLDNIQWVHKHINVCKHTYGNEEFIKICNLISKLNPR